MNDYLIRIRDAGGWKAHVARHRALLVGRLRILLRRSSTTRSASSARWSGPTDENDVGMKAFFAKQMSTMLVKQAEEYLAHANMWAKAAGIPPTLTIGGEPQPLKRKRGVKKEVDARSRRPAKHTPTHPNVPAQPNKPKYNPTGYMMFAEHIRNTESARRRPERRRFELETRRRRR